MHIALVADFVAKDGAMDREAAQRATTVYLPEMTVRMLPDPISCAAASLIAGEVRPVLTTDVTISPDGEVARGLDLSRANQDQSASSTTIASIGSSPTRNSRDELADSRRRLNLAATRCASGDAAQARMLIQRREAKVRVHGNDIEIEVLDTGSPSRLLVGEFMVLSNYVAARYAADHRIPIIYRVQPQGSGDFAGQRPRLSLYPEYHAGIGLDYYAQFSSPIRRYADLVLQRQLIAALATPDHFGYSQEELLAVLAGAENAEAEGRELERRAKRYWILRYLERHARDGPSCPRRHARGRQRRAHRLRRARHAARRADACPIRCRSWSQIAASIRCADGSHSISSLLPTKFRPVRAERSDRSAVIAIYQGATWCAGARICLCRMSRFGFDVSSERRLNAPTTHPRSTPLQSPNA